MLNYIRNKLDQHFGVMLDVACAVFIGLLLAVGALAYFDVLTK
jgi:hypothetical protein